MQPQINRLCHRPRGSAEILRDPRGSDRFACRGYCTPHTTSSLDHWLLRPARVATPGLHPAHDPVSVCFVFSSVFSLSTTAMRRCSLVYRAASPFWTSAVAWRRTFDGSPTTAGLPRIVWTLTSKGNFLLKARSFSLTRTTFPLSSLVSASSYPMIRCGLNFKGHLV